jgi:hypothetical protein
MVNVRLLEVSLYARGPRKGDVCRDVAFHEEMHKIPRRYTWNKHISPDLAEFLAEILDDVSLEMILLFYG